MKKLILLLLFLAPASSPVLATIIEANNPDYAGETLIFNRYTDPITEETEHLFSLAFDNQGKASAHIDLTKITFVFTDFDVYRGMLFAEPGKTEKLQLPPVRKKSFADQKNPFFKPVPFWFKTNSDLNQKISGFDGKFNQITNQFFNELYYQQSKIRYDSVIQVLNHLFPDEKNDVFQNHKKLKLKMMESDVFRLKAEDIAPFLSSVNPQYWETPTFIELFDKVFSNKLSFDVKDVKGTDLRNAIARNDLNFLLNFIKTKYNLKTPNTELAALKMLHDGFYSGDFAHASILNLLRSDKLAKSNIATIRTITQNVIKKLEFLLPGSKAPVICLKDIDGNHKCSDENKDKFKYLVFADTEMIVCREQLKYLTKIHEDFQKYLEIIVLLRKTDLIEMKMFLAKNNVPGLKLIDENGNYIKQYKVRSFPTCLLLNENHDVIYNEAKAPLDGFEQQFGKYLQNELFQRQRNQSR